MKYIALIALLALVSCKRSYVCNCKSQDGITFNRTVSQVSETNKEQAQKMCDNDALTVSSQSLPITCEAVAN